MAWLSLILFAGFFARLVPRWRLNRKEDNHAVSKVDRRERRRNRRKRFFQGFAAFAGIFTSYAFKTGVIGPVLAGVIVGLGILLGVILWKRLVQNSP